MSLNRFIDAQAGIYQDVLSELKNGKKKTHWMWFIFPQIEGLGRSPTAIYYAIKDLSEASEYLSHPILGPRLMECTEALLSIHGKTANEIMGSPDDMKLKSSMTIFASVAEMDSVFEKILVKFFQGEMDVMTLKKI